jgi:hypothetical protein
VVYSLTDSADGQFSIDATSGVIRLEKPLQVRPQAALELTVRASDLGTPIPLSTLGSVSVSVVGLEDYLPVFLNTEHSVRVREDAPMGTEVLQLAALTRPGAEKTGYRILGGNEQGRFRLDTRTGETAGCLPRTASFLSRPIFSLLLHLPQVPSLFFHLRASLCRNLTYSSMSPFWTLCPGSSVIHSSLSWWLPGLSSVPAPGG